MLGESLALVPLKRIPKYDLLFTDLIYLQEIDKQECATGAVPPSENPASGAPQDPGVSEIRAGPPEAQGVSEILATAMRSRSNSSDCSTTSGSHLDEEVRLMKEWCYQDDEEAQNSPDNVVPDPGAKQGPVPRILYSTMGHEDKSVKVKSRRHRRKTVTSKVPDPVDRVSTAVQRVSLQELQHSLATLDPLPPRRGQG